MQIRRGDHKMRRETNVHERCLSIYASYLGYRDTVKDIRIPWTHNSRNSSSIDISYVIEDQLQLCSFWQQVALATVTANDT